AADVPGAAQPQHRHSAGDLPQRVPRDHASELRARSIRALPGVVRLSHQRKEAAALYRGAAEVAILTERKEPPPARRVLAVTAQFRGLARLLAVFAAVFSIGPAGRHHALARRVRAFFLVGHGALLAPDSRPYSNAATKRRSSSGSTGLITCCWNPAAS